MPRFDGTGPDGRGAMTGGGRGYCVTPLPVGPGNAVFGRSLRRGRGRRQRFFTDRPVDTLNSQETVGMLKEEAALLQAELKRVQSHIDALENKNDGKE